MSDMTGEDLEVDDEPAQAVQPKDRRSMGRLVTRIIIYSGLLVALVLALLDFRQKQFAEASFKSWDDKFHEIVETGKDMRRSNVELLKQGNPTAISGKPGKEHRFARSMTKYIWKGPFREYSVTVYYGLGADDPIVEEIVSSWSLIDPADA
ncbi:MAG: hypothetical protein ABGZ17_28485 [Planctomycetaceae bacterium]